MSSRKIYYEKNNSFKKKNTIKERLRDILEILTPIFLIILYLCGFLMVLKLPSSISKYLSIEKFGQSGALLRCTYWSNLIMLLWLTVGTSIFCILLIIWCFKGNKNKNKLQARVFARGKLTLSVIFISFIVFLSFAYLRNEKVLDIIQRYHSDIILLKNNEIEIYEGMIQEKEEQWIEGGYYEEKPMPLKILNNYYFAIDEERKMFLCPDTLLNDRKIERDRYYKIRYLPHSKIVVSIESIN